MVRAGVSTSEAPLMAAVPLNRQPLPGGVSAVEPDWIDTLRTACTSVAPPVLAVNAGRMLAGRWTAWDSRWVPSIQTVTVPPVTLTLTVCVPTRRGGIVVAAA